MRVQRVGRHVIRAPCGGSERGCDLHRPALVWQVPVMAQADCDPQDRPKRLYPERLLRLACTDKRISKPEFPTHWVGIWIGIALVLWQSGYHLPTKGVDNIYRTDSALVRAGAADHIDDPSQCIQKPDKLGVAGYRKRSGKLCTQWVASVALHLMRPRPRL